MPWPVLPFKLITPLLHNPLDTFNYVQIDYQTFMEPQIVWMVNCKLCVEFKLIKNLRLGRLAYSGKA